MYADDNVKSLESVDYLLNLARNTDSRTDRLTTMKKAAALLDKIINETEFALERKKVLK